MTIFFPKVVDTGTFLMQSWSQCQTLPPFFSLEVFFVGEFPEVGKIAGQEGVLSMWRTGVVPNMNRAPWTHLNLHSW